MKAEKQALLDDLLSKLEQSPYFLVADYQGLTVSHFAELRKRLKEVGAGTRVLKNTMVKRALRDAGFPELDEQALTGQNMLISGGSEAPAAAKVLKNFTAEFKKPVIKAGLLDGTPLDAEGVKALADLPSREELLAKLLSVINAPATKLVRTIQEPASALARVLQAKADKG